MSSTQSFTTSVEYGTGGTYYNAGSAVSVDPSAYGVAFSVFTTAKYANSWITLKDAGKNELFPNSTVKPIKADYSFRTQRTGINTCKIEAYVAGTNIFTQDTGSGKVTHDLTNKTDSAITNSNKSSEIKFYLTHGATTSIAIIWLNITYYFTRYDFSATAGSNVTSASVSSSTGYDGDTITYSCVTDGGTFDGWYNGSTRVSTSQTYTHTVNGADLTLEARASAPSITKSFSAIYGNSIIISQTQSSNVAVGYNSGTITTLTDNDRIKHLLCKNKLMNTAVTACGKTLNCGGKVSSYNIPMLYCYGSWELNKGLTTGTATLVDASGWVTTPFIPVSGKISVTVETGGTRSGSMLNEYDSGFGYASYWGASTNPRTFTLDTAASYIRCTFLMSALANCSIYDNTNGKYLFKGGNV